MKKRHFLFFFIFTAFEVIAQPDRTIFLNSGFSFNNNLQLNAAKVTNSKGYVLTYGGSLTVFSVKEKYLSIGIAGKTIFASGVRNAEKFNVVTLRLVFPLKMVFPLTEKWLVSPGFNFQNNIDLNDPDFRLGYKNLWRLDYSVGMKYLIKNQWFMTTKVKLNLQNIPDVFFFNDPKFALLVGIEKSFFKDTKNNL
jgi:hypothetical protein